MGFKRWLESVPSIHIPDDPDHYQYRNLKNYIDPDFFLHRVHDIRDVGGKIVAFIYTSNHEIFYGKEDTAWHVEIRDDNGVDEKTNRNSLHGRLAPINNKIYVSFWEASRHLLNDLLKPCLQRLEKDGMIVLSRDMISTFNHGTMPIAELPDIAREISSKEQKKLDLMRQLHLMGAQQKRQAMGELGLAQGYKKNPWQSASDELGITSPGKRLWALNSEANRG